MSVPPRRTSFGMLLRRSKSGDLGSKGKKAQALREAELERQRQVEASRIPPKLPDFANHTEQLSKSFGPELTSASPPTNTGSYTYSAKSSMDAPRSYAPGSAVPYPVPPLPNGGYDPYARTESMTNRGRYSYASSAISTINGPRRVRRRKDPTPFK